MDIPFGQCGHFEKPWFVVVLVPFLSFKEEGVYLYFWGSMVRQNMERLEKLLEKPHIQIF